MPIDTSLRSSSGGDGPSLRFRPSALYGAWHDASSPRPIFREGGPRPYVATVFFKGADLVAWFLNGLRLPGFTMLDHGV